MPKSAPFCLDWIVFLKHLHSARSMQEQENGSGDFHWHKG